jgi:hypothetical protein
MKSLNIPFGVLLSTEKYEIYLLNIISVSLHPLPSRRGGTFQNSTFSKRTMV